MTLMRINPFRELRTVDNIINRFFNESISSLWPDVDRSFSLGSRAPLADIHETENELVFSFEVPGLEKDQINITVSDGTLTVSGESKFEETKDREYQHVERSYGSFCRSFRLPTSVQNDKISAQLKNGVLIVTLPKREEARSRQIPVKVE